MRITLLLLFLIFVPSTFALSCDTPSENQPLPSAVDKETPDSEPLAWPPKPQRTLLQGMWLAPAGDARQTLLWLRGDGSWTTASVHGNSASVDSLDAIVTSLDSWHIERLDERAASYALVLGKPRPTRCGSGAMLAPTYPIVRLTATRLVLQARDQSADAMVYRRVDPAVAARITRLVDQSDEAAATATPSRKISRPASAPSTSRGGTGRKP